MLVNGNQSIPVTVEGKSYCRLFFYDTLFEIMGMLGTAIFIDPFIPVQLIDGIKNYMERHKLNSVSDIVGNLQY